MVPWSLRPDLRRSRGATKSARRYLRFGGKLKHGDPCRCCPGFSALRGRRTSWYSNRPYKMVGMTGVAPARAYAHEFLRLACLLFSPHAEESLVAEVGLAPTRALRPAILKTAVSAVSPHREDGAQGEIRTPTPSPAAGFEAAVSAVPTTRANWCGRGDSHSHAVASGSFSNCCVYCFTTTAKWSQHRDVRPAVSLTKGAHRFLCFAGEKLEAPVGIAPTTFAL